MMQGLDVSSRFGNLHSSPILRRLWGYVVNAAALRADGSRGQLWNSWVSPHVKQSHTSYGQKHNSEDLSPGARVGSQEFEDLEYKTWLLSNPHFMSANASLLSCNGDRYASGGELFDYIVARGRVPEPEVPGGVELCCKREGVRSHGTRQLVLCMATLSFGSIWVHTSVTVAILAVVMLCGVFLS